MTPAVIHWARLPKAAGFERRLGREDAMPGPWRKAPGSDKIPGSEYERRHEHAFRASERSRRPGLYEIALREAIATQHALGRADHLNLRACTDCGKAYLLATVWQPLSDEGAVACPRCGAEAIAWDGSRGYVAFWQRDAALPGRVGVSRAPAARSSQAETPPAASRRAAKS